MTVATATPQPLQPARPGQRIRVVFAALMLVLLLASLDQTIVSTLPRQPAPGDRPDRLPAAGSRQPAGRTRRGSPRRPGSGS